MDLLDDAVPLVAGIVHELLAEQVIAGLNSNRANSGHFCELQLGGGKFNFPHCLVLHAFLLRSLGELLKLFDELPLLHGSDVKQRAELLLAQDAKVGLKLLEVGFGVACVVHQVTRVLVALGQLDLDTIRLCEPLGILVLRVRDRGSPSDPSVFAVRNLDCGPQNCVFGAHNLMIPRLVY